MYGLSARRGSWSRVIGFAKEDSSSPGHEGEEEEKETPDTTLQQMFHAHLPGKSSHVQLQNQTRKHTVRCQCVKITPKQ